MFQNLSSYLGERRTLQLAQLASLLIISAINSLFWAKTGMGYLGVSVVMSFLTSLACFAALLFPAIFVLGGADDFDEADGVKLTLVEKMGTFFSVGRAFLVVLAFHVAVMYFKFGA